MRCHWCGKDDDSVVDSRLDEDGEAVRRRRECHSCGRRFTTFERVEDVGLWVLKRDGTREQYDRKKLVSGVSNAIKNRPVSDQQVQALVSSVEKRLRRKGPEIRTQDIGVEVLSALRKLDEVAYVRFASVYKDFQEVADFEKELGKLLEKKEPKKRRGS
ncbi:MAG: transcriptional regulator NrdR [Actinobacteria bacterium]|nr:transcriptional regulator NrdR [Actinomycetota bacterium]